MKGKSSDIIKVGNIYIYKLIFSQDGSPPHLKSSPMLDFRLFFGQDMRIQEHMIPSVFAATRWA